MTSAEPRLRDGVRRKAREFSIGEAVIARGSDTLRPGFCCRAKRLSTRSDNNANERSCNIRADWVIRAPPLRKDHSARPPDESEIQDCVLGAEAAASSASVFQVGPSQDRPVPNSSNRHDDFASR